MPSVFIPENRRQTEPAESINLKASGVCFHVEDYQRLYRLEPLIILVLLKGADIYPARP